MAHWRDQGPIQGKQVSINEVVARFVWGRYAQRQFRIAQQRMFDFLFVVRAQAYPNGRMSPMEACPQDKW